ncbi:MAG: sulfurtransferase TusA family protein [Hyphomicrobium sp.]
MADRTLDVRGYACPIPILKAKKTLTEMAEGATLEVLATDPAAPKDFVAFCKATGHALVDSGADDNVYRFLIRRA